MIPAIHLSPRALLTETTSRAFPLKLTAEPRSPHAIAQLLDVENSPRYKREKSQTFCNIYAYDFCYLSGVYLPRVWWNDDAIARIGKGESVIAIYNQTFREMNANSLYQWLTWFGPDFGWRGVGSTDQLQQHANTGRPCVISAMRRDRSKPGHISCVLPEADILATRDNGRCTHPVQSQAGARNFRCSVTPGRWWERDFAEFGFFVNEQK